MPLLDKQLGGQAVANANPALSTCTRVFHFMLPFVIGLGTAAAISAVIMLYLVPVPEGSVPDPMLQTAGQITAATGNTILGLSTFGAWIWRGTSEAPIDERGAADCSDDVYKTVFVVFVLLLISTLVPGIGGSRTMAIMQGIGFTAGGIGVLVAGVAMYFSVRLRKYYAPKREQYSLIDSSDSSPDNELNEKFDAPIVVLHDDHLDSRPSLEGLYDPSNEVSRNPLHAKLSDSHFVNRRLASGSIEFVVNTTGIVSTIGVALASLLVWYLYLRGRQTKLDPPRRRTTIIKKRPTFVKGKRRATHKPTLSSLRSEGNLVPLS